MPSHSANSFIPMEIPLYFDETSEDLQRGGLRLIQKNKVSDTVKWLSYWLIMRINIGATIAEKSLFRRTR